MKKISFQSKTKDLWQAPTWYNALSLTERMAREQVCARDMLPKHQELIDSATQRLSAWRTQPPFDHGAFFAERLASDALTEADLLALLAEPAADVKRHAPSIPDWLSTLTRAFSKTDAAEKTLPISQEMLENHPVGPYLPAIRPLLADGWTSLHKGIQALQQRYTSLPIAEQQVCQSFLHNLVPQMLFQISKAVILEMHVARIQGRLQGDTPEERFTDFVQQLHREEIILPLLAEYPVLARLLVSTINRWKHYALETLDHLCADWPDICTLFTPGNDPGLLVEVQAGAGDTHRDGRSVQILKFSSGLQLLYKPKPLAIDKHFQELLTWLNERGAEPPFRILKVLDRGNYGWSEFVTTRSCTSQDEIMRFYERQGAYLALFYALHATDCHSENVIASGEHPMLVDLESLFHPHVEGETSTQPGASAFRALNQSVLRVGLLPQWTWASADAPGVDISGLGGQQGQVMPYPLPGWGESGTDQMHLVLQHVEMAGSQNRPRLNDSEVHVLDYKNSITAGFTRMYRLLRDLREPLLHEQLPRFAHDEIRVILRPTRFYGLLLAASFHPDLLRDALERDRFFDRLWQGVEHWPDLAKFIPAERQDLLRGDIPLFATFPDSRTIFTSAGKPVADLYNIAGLDLAQRQLQSLHEDDLTRQLWIIEASLATLQMGYEDQTRLVLPLHPVQQPVKRAQMIAQAKALGMRLEKLAVQHDDGACWLGVHLFREKTWGLFPVGIDLYDGASGIALFLAYLGSVTGEARFTSLAELALAAIRKQVASVHTQSESREPEKAEEINIGAFEGWCSVIYLLTHLSVLWKEPELIHEAEELAAHLAASIARDKHFDILSGSAGCILTLLSLYVIHPSARTLDLAVQCGEHLLASAQTTPSGSGWATNKEGPPLGGFSHGNAGIALSLLKLAEASGDERFRQTALSALAYDRSLFIPAQQNWADIRVDSTHTSQTESSDIPTTGGQQHCMVAWCHGASGIGLARLEALRHMDDEQMWTDIDIALNTTLEQGLTGNHSLCHGALGNIDLLLTATRRFNRPEDQQRLERALAIVVGSLERHGRVTGVPLGVETPGLMTGLAGMGYELLRLAEPDNVPSILLLAPPIWGSGMHTATG